MVSDCRGALCKLLAYSETGYDRPLLKSCRFYRPKTWLAESWLFFVHLLFEHCLRQTLRMRSLHKSGYFCSCQGSATLLCTLITTWPPCTMTRYFAAPGFRLVCQRLLHSAELPGENLFWPPAHRFPASFQLYSTVYRCYSTKAQTHAHSESMRKHKVSLKHIVT